MFSWNWNLRSRWWLRAALIVAALLGAASLSSPDEARAIPPVGPVGGGLGEVIGAGVGAVTGGLGSSVVDGFGALLGKLFSWPADVINRRLLAWLVAVPDYAISPRANARGQAGSNLAELAQTTSAMAFGALGAVGTVACLRYWAAGLSGSGGFEALGGLGRTVAAALLVVAWPWIFRHSAELTNAASKGLLGSGTVLDDTSRMLGATFAAAISLNFFSIIIACCAGVMFLALLMCKIVASASAALVFVAMPVAIVLWVIPEFAWITRSAMRAFGVILAIPLGWALCFATFAAIGTDALALKGAGSFADALLMPLVALALLWVTVTLPRVLARMALLGGFSGGAFVSRTAAFVTARRADAAISQALPGSMGGSQTPSGGAPSSSNGSPGGQAKSGAATGVTVAAMAAAGPAGAAGAAGGAAGAAKAGAAGARPAATSAPVTGTPAQSRQRSSTGWSGPGLPTPSWREIKDRVAPEMETASARRGATTRQDVAAAMRVFRPETQQAIKALAETKNGRIGGEMVHQAAREGLDAREREAFRTLAAATPETRVLGMADFLGESLATAPPEDSPSVNPRAEGGPFGTPEPPRPSQPDPTEHPAEDR